MSAAADAASAAAVDSSNGAWGFAEMPPLSDFTPAAQLGFGGEAAAAMRMDECPAGAEPTAPVEYMQLLQGAVVVGRVVQCQVCTHRLARKHTSTYALTFPELREGTWWTHTGIGKAPSPSNQPRMRPGGAIQFEYATESRPGTPSVAS